MLPVQRWCRYTEGFFKFNFPLMTLNNFESFLLTFLRHWLRIMHFLIEDTRVRFILHQIIIVITSEVHHAIFEVKWYYLRNVNKFDHEFGKVSIWWPVKEAYQIIIAFMRIPNKDTFQTIMHERHLTYFFTAKQFSYIELQAASLRISTTAKSIKPIQKI